MQACLGYSAAFTVTWHAHTMQMELSTVENIRNNRRAQLPLSMPCTFEYCAGLIVNLHNTVVQMYPENVLPDVLEKYK